MTITFSGCWLLQIRLFMWLAAVHCPVNWTECT